MVEFWLRCHVFEIEMPASLLIVWGSELVIPIVIKRRRGELVRTHCASQVVSDSRFPQYSLYNLLRLCDDGWNLFSWDVCEDLVPDGGTELRWLPQESLCDLVAEELTAKEDDEIEVCLRTSVFGFCLSFNFDRSC